MSAVGDLVQSVVDGALKEIIRKTAGSGKRSRRRKRSAGGSAVLRTIEAFLKPARRRKSRRKTARARSVTARRRVAARTRNHRRSLRRGAATR